jgi:hypothetical protein
LDAWSQGVLWVPKSISTSLLHELGQTNRFKMCTSNDRVVFSIDLTITRSLGVMGELACFKGLKFMITFKILLAIWGRARIRMEREFKVASTSTASLVLLVSCNRRSNMVRT